MRRTSIKKAFGWTVGIAMAALVAAAPSSSPAMEAGGTCGNGVIDGDEACDDGNRHAGDCCSPECRLEESHLGCAGDCLCATCGDGVDNDEDGLTDAEDPKCATLAALQRWAWVDPGALTADDAVSRPQARLVSPVSGDDALAGSAHAGICDAGVGACVCPEDAAACQAAGRPCSSDAGCEPVPYPAGESRAWVCDREAVAAGACAAVVEKVQREIEAIGALSGVDLALARASASVPVEVAFGPGVHIVDVEDVWVDDGAELVLVGEGEATVVLRVGGALHVGQGAGVRIAGDLAADRILWVLGPGTTFRLGDEAEFIGSVLVDAGAEVSVGKGGSWDGAALGAARGPS